MPDKKMTSAVDAAVLERRRKLAEWYDQYEIMAEILLDAELSGTMKKGRDWMEGFRSEMVSGLAGGVAGKKALDIGCQYGVFSFRLAEDGARVTGMDISEKWVNRCIKDAGLKHPDQSSPSWWATRRLCPSRTSPSTWWSAPRWWSTSISPATC